MNLDKNVIKEALEFYELYDEKYLNKCYDCIASIDEKLKKRITYVYDILYYDEANKIIQRWKTNSKEELFGENCHSYITSILVLLGYKIHKENIKKYGLNKEQIELHKKRVRESITNDIYERKYDGIRNSQMIWASHFINVKIIEIGRLQYQFVQNNPITEEQENCIKIHIPRGDKLDIEDVKQSIKKSKNLVNKYFNLDNPNYYCKSWLLSKQIRNLLDSKSNIIKFGNLFDIVEEKDCVSDILNFVFNLKECNNYQELNEDTSLQRKIKQYLLEGKTINIGVGTLKKEI